MGEGNFIHSNDCYMKNNFVLILSLVAFCASAQPAKKAVKQPVLGHRSATILNIDGSQFKDLNRNGKLDKYEDWRLTNDERSKDLVSKMSVEEKVGFMLISTAGMKTSAMEAANSMKKTGYPTQICLRASLCHHL
jgi:hypothetical protein